MNIKQKLLFSFLTLTFLILGVSHLTEFVIENEARTNFEEIGGEIMPGNVALARMTTELYHTLELVRHFSEETDSGLEQEIRQALSTLSTYKTMYMLYHSAEEEWHSEVDETVEKFSSHIAEYVLLLKKGSSQEELNAVSNKIDLLMGGFVASVNPHIEIEFRNGMQKLEETKRIGQKAERIFIIAGLVILAITVWASLLLAYLFARPIRNLRDAALEVGQGKLDITLQPTSKDEIGELTTAFNDMIANLSHEQDERLLAERALRESEENYREIFNATSEAIFIHDAKTGVILDVNQTMLDMYGYTHEEALNLTIGDLSSGESYYDHGEAVKFVRKAVAEGPQLFDWRARRKNGELFWVEVALKSKKIGGQERVLAVVRDISDRRKIEGELLQAQKIEAIGTLAGGIAHDFNNILTGIFGYTELARLKLGNNPELQGILDEVLNAGHRARNLVAQILTFSRKTEYEKLLLQPATIIKEALKLLRSTIPTTIEIKENIKSHGAVLGDPTQIHQIIMNLCTNAYHSMRTTGGVLAVSLEETDLTGNDYPSAGIEPGRYLRLEVSDTGTGMDAQTKEKIFEPYFTTKEAGAGTGLGLAVVHGIVKDFRGHISVYSEPGQGTTFHVYLPLVERESLQLGESEIRAENKHPQGGTERIMVIDDEEAIVKYIQNALEEKGYMITSYTNGMQALQDFAKRPGDFDLVITDMTMPYMTGADLAQKILELKADMPIILCTGYSELINKEKAMAMGIAVYLQKPIAVNSLLRETRNALDRVPKKQPRISN